MSEKDILLNLWKRESPVTVKVLKAFPADKGDWKPHDKSRTAKQLAWVIAGEEVVFVDGALTGTVDFSKMPDEPGTYAEVVTKYEAMNKDAIGKIVGASEEDLMKMTQFPTGPKTMGELRRIDLLWMMILDSIHHRGQFSVYVREAGGMVPSIYGPSADEPWT